MLIHEDPSARFPAAECGRELAWGRGLGDCREIVVVTTDAEANAPCFAAGPGPIDVLLKSNGLLVEKVLPQLGIELTGYQPTLRGRYAGRGWRQASRAAHAHP